MHCLKNVSYSLNLVLDPGHDAASRSTSPFRMLVRRQLERVWKEFSVVDMFSQFKDSQTAEAVYEYGIWAKWTRLRNEN